MAFLHKLIAATSASLLSTHLQLSNSTILHDNSTLLLLFYPKIEYWAVLYAGISAEPAPYTVNCHK